MRVCAHSRPGQPSRTPFGDEEALLPVPRGSRQLLARQTLRRSRPAARHGVAAAEFAILLPFLVGLFLFAIDFARILFYTITIETALQNGALFGSRSFDNQNQQWIGNVQYWQGPNGQLVSQENVTSELDTTNLNPALSNANINVTGGTDADGNPVNIVTITYTFNTFVPYPGVPSPVTITRTAQVRIAPPTPS
jgi:Flp pilus assembly protein TadG